MSAGSSPFPTHLPGDTPGEATEEESSAWVSSSYAETQMELQTPGSGLAQPQLLRSFREWNQWMESISPTLSSVTTFQINESFFKIKV